MPSAGKSFRDLELLNVEIDVWIDEEKYRSVNNTLKPIDSEVTALIEKIFREDNRGDDTKIGKKELDSLFSDLFGKVKNSAENLITISKNGEDFSLSKKNRNWAPLFFAKYIRAKILKNGTDDYTKHLDNLVTYLQRKLPYQSPKNDQEVIIQHLYYQELSACGKAGLGSLGFAVQAHDLIAKKESTGNGPHFSFELYKLWAKLNQGIGYWHSNQKREAAQAFDEIIRGFEDASKYKDESDKRVWSSLILDQAILFKAEVQEDSQFSYHTLQTLGRLRKSDKRERRLIKEALAYRDMGRLDAAKSKIKELLSYDRKKHYDSVSETFQQFSRWENRTKKKSLGSQILGLLFDYYLQEFQESRGKKQTVLNDDVKNLANNFICYKCRLLSCAPDRRSYYQQVARFLEWLSDDIRSKIGDRKAFFNNQLRRLYGEIREELPGISADLRGLREKAKIDLNEFGRYEYDRFVNSMEKFYRNVNGANSENCEIKKDIGEIDFLNDEISFLEALNKFERDNQWLYSFKDLERRQRKQHLKTEKIRCGKGKPLECFHPPIASNAFDGILNCVEKIKDKKKYDLHEYFRTGLKPMADRDYESIMKRENKRFLEYLKFKSKHPLLDSTHESYHFLGLQRWNSQTPTLTLSQGGGYFIYEQDANGRVDLGIAIDPGFDFVDNLFNMGFTLYDIDFILISHAHLDHMRDFEPIVTALLDLKKRTNGVSKKKIHVMMSLGVYHKLEPVITNTTLREYLADTYIVDIDKDIEGNYLKPFRFRRNGLKAKGGKLVSVIDSEKEDYEIKITPTMAYHNDYSEESDSFGYILKMFDRDNKVPLFSFGYTGDTKWEKSLLKDWGYHECDVVCIHLGALIESEKDRKNVFSYYKGPECEALIEKKGHPYLFGLLRFLKSIKEGGKNKNKLILISEFGEELKGGIRIDLVHRLNHLFEDHERVCLPVDIGLNVILGKKPLNNGSGSHEFEKPNLVWCFGCERFVEADKIGYRHFGYGRDEALFYFCDTCLKSKPENVIQDKMRSICEHGIPLQKAE